jgi:hypothetical protein
MSDNENLFDDNQEETLIDDNQNETINVDDLVGDGKKFKDLNALAKAKIESDRFIERLKRETAEIRKDLNERLSVEDLLKKMQTTTTSGAQGDSNQSRGNGSETGKDEFDISKIDELLENKLRQRSQAESASQNLKLVKESLEEHFGSSGFGYEVKKALSEVGLTVDEANAMAKTKPQAFLKLVGVGVKQSVDTSGSIPRTRVNSQPNSTSSTARNQSFYENIRKNDPKTYWSAKTQSQLHKDAIAQGERFFT